MFKDQIANDFNTFFNISEFSEVAKIDGRDITVTIDNDKLSQKIQKDYDGIQVGDIFYYAKASDFPEIPKLRNLQIFNGKRCTVFDVREDNGILEVTLQRNEG